MLDDENREMAAIWNTVSGPPVHMNSFSHRDHRGAWSCITLGSGLRYAVWYSKQTHWAGRQCLCKCNISNKNSPVFTPRLLLLQRLSASTFTLSYHSLQSLQSHRSGSGFSPEEKETNCSNLMVLGSLALFIPLCPTLNIIKNTCGFGGCKGRFLEAFLRLLREVRADIQPNLPRGYVGKQKAIHGSWPVLSHPHRP